MKNLSPKQLGQALGISESTIKRWIDAGRLPVTRTLGGHRRINIPDAIRFVRSENISVKDPASLGLDIQVGSDDDSNWVEALTETFYQALENCDDVKARSLLMQAYLSGRSLPELLEGPVMHAMCELGEAWSCNYDIIEDMHKLAARHCAQDSLVRSIGELRALMPDPGEDAPVGITGSLTSTYLLLPSLMSSAVLTEIGWRTYNLGPSAQLMAVLATAQRETNTKGIWLSVHGSEEEIAHHRKPLKLLAMSCERDNIPLFLVGAQAGLMSAFAPNAIVHSHNEYMHTVVNTARGLL